MAHCLPGVHTQAQRSFSLTFVYRLNACTKDLRQIRAIVETQTKDSIEEGGKKQGDKGIALKDRHKVKSDCVRIKASFREQITYTIIPQEQLYENRRTTHYLDIDNGNPTNERETRKAS